VPTYSYRCTECDQAFDIQQAFTDDTLTVCPSCGGVLRKVFSPIGVSFSGSGFYRNDSRAKPASESGGAEKAGTEKSGSEKSSTEKSGSAKTGSEKTGSEKSSDKSAKKEKAATTPGTSGSTGKATTSSAAS
jgi:putative FmdB family regulatory protein